MGIVTTSIRIPKEIIDKLREIAKYKNRSVNYIINAYIRAGLNDNE